MKDKRGPAGSRRGPARVEDAGFRFSLGLLYPFDVQILLPSAVYHSIVYMKDWCSGDSTPTQGHRLPKHACVVSSHHPFDAPCGVGGMIDPFISGLQSSWQLCPGLKSKSDSLACHIECHVPSRYAYDASHLPHRSILFLFRVLLIARRSCRARACHCKTLLGENHSNKAGE